MTPLSGRGNVGAKDLLGRRTVHNTGFQGLFGVDDLGRQAIGCFIEEALQVGVTHILDQVCKSQWSIKEPKHRKDKKRDM